MAALERFGAATQSWFEASFPAPTRVQIEGWPRLVDGENALLLAPTGSGKTLAAFLATIDRLTRLPADDVPGVRAIYVSPLKALVYDVERNLRGPLVGVKRAGERLGVPLRDVRVDVRTGDTTSRERRLQVREPADILVTTPESLYLLLTSAGREVLRSVETVILDEIHVMAGTKRGVHLSLSLERLAAFADRDPQRIGLSATQHPLRAVAQYLGGDRPVSIVDASEKPRLEVTISVPVEDMDARHPRAAPNAGTGAASADGPAGDGPGEKKKKKKSGPILSGPFTDGPRRQPDRTGERPDPGSTGIWPSIYPKMLELIRSHRSTIVFTNSRLLCERLAKKLNELAGEELVLAHHGSISHKRRGEIEEQLKQGKLPALVATSSLELGIDMGAVDLVLLVESPGSAARGLQRIGRAGHGVGETSRGVVFPKFKGDLLECAVVVDHMRQGRIEATRMPKLCVDVLSQHLVAMCALEPWSLTDLERVVHRAAPFADMSREVLTSVLDMLSGRYPSDELADLAPRLLWDRETDVITARRGARVTAVMNAGTIPDRGLYHVHLGVDGPRIGELDEEMVYESRAGETIVLGASTWRIQEIQRDRVIVVPAPGEPGRLPFWHGERPGRPIELGRSMGAFLGTLTGKDRSGIQAALDENPALDDYARRNLVSYIDEQQKATGALPTDKAITVESFRDELGDWRVCILTPFGSRVHAPWALALEQRLSLGQGFETQVMWSDDGIALRLPESDDLPTTDQLFPEPDDLEDLVVEQLRHTALFATRFRENAARALLLPRRAMKGRTPLWLQRRKSQHLLAIAQRYPSFPIVLETYRECMQDVFDLPSLIELLRAVKRREVRVDDVQTKSASPFARSLVFQYIAQYLYDGDAPLAERRAAALSLDRGLLRELLGQDELRDLLDPSAVADVEAELSWLSDDRKIEHKDALHDLLRRLGDLRKDELVARSASDPTTWLEELVRERRVALVRIASEERYIAAEDAARYRDALGTSLPGGLPAAFLESQDAPLDSLLLRFARTHGPFLADDVARRFGLLPAQVESILQGFTARGLLIYGELRPGGVRREYCDPEVLRRLKRKSLAKLREEVAPVDSEVFARFLPAWHGLHQPRKGLQRLDEVLTQLEGLAMPYSVLEGEVLPARVGSFEASMLDELGATGAVVWVGQGALGTHDGRIALFRRERVPLLVDAPLKDALEPLQAALLQHLEERGASFFSELSRIGGPAPTKEVLEALWDLVWKGLVTNDTFQPLRGLRARGSERRPRHIQMIGGRWSAVSSLIGVQPSPTERAHARVTTLLERYGVVSREAAQAADIVGGFQALYPILRAMEESGKIRRGHFVDGLTGAQFALPGAVDRLRTMRERDDDEARVIAATDPAAPWGALLPWPDVVDAASGAAQRPRRIAGALVVTVGGRPVLYLEKGGKSLVTFPAARQDGPDLEKAIRALQRNYDYKSLRVARVDGAEAMDSAVAPKLLAAGFAREHPGLVLSRAVGA